MTNPIDPWNRLTSAGPTQRQVAEKQQARNASAPEAAAAPAPAPVAGDQVQLSEVAKQARAEPSFDRAKVDAIKQAVQNGQYPLDARRMAESFLAIEQMIRD